MNRQVKSLRKVVNDHKEKRLSTFSSLPSSPRRIIAVTSGKGGVGKSNIAINMAIALAFKTMKVLVIDADLGLANIDLLLGINTPYTLEHVASGEVGLDEIQVQGPGGIKIIPGGSGVRCLLRASNEERNFLIRNLEGFDNEVDFTIIDTGAGLSDNVLSFLKFVNEIIVVTTPEPTSVADAYATIKMIAYENPNACIMVVVNMAANSRNAENIAENLSIVAKRFLAIDIKYLGFIPRDSLVLKAVTLQQPFFLTYPSSNASKAIIRLTEKLIDDNQKAAHNTNQGLAGLFSRIFDRVKIGYF